MFSNPMGSDPEMALPDTRQSESAREIDDFIYLISHDVRASVRALLELPQWIQEDLEEAGVKVEGPVAASIDMMNRHTGRLDRMLVDLLTYSRVGRMQNMCHNDLEAGLDALLDDIKMPAGFEITRDLKAGQVQMGDRDFMTLLGALIQNGFKHHDKSAGRIHVSSIIEGSSVVIRVSDDGPGILPEHTERVFGPMQTIRPRDEVEGSGMGLATVRRIAEIYGGTARIGHPLFGRGATIEVELPATD